jgi:phage-related protein
MTPGASRGGLRLAPESIPQASGTLIHRRFKWGYEIQMKLDFWKNGDVAFGEDRQTMWDNLVLHLNSILNDDGRLRWLPTGRVDANANYRMVDDLRLLAWPTPVWDGFKFSAVFQLESPFPYGLDYEEITTFINGGTTVTVTNLGTSEMYPVFKVYGPTPGFTITNHHSGLAIVYDDTLPGALPIGGGSYVEIDTFRNTVYLNGDQANRKAGIDVLQTDFFPLEPNVAAGIECDGADCDMLWQSAWA